MEQIVAFFWYLLARRDGEILQKQQITDGVVVEIQLQLYGHYHLKYSSVFH
jgi:hypothetical protein